MNLVDDISARRARRRLRRYLVRSIDMFMRQAGALDTMEAYIVYLQNYARRARDIEDDDRVIAEKVLSDLWAKFITRLDNLFKLITALLNDLINDRSNVVLAPAYVPLLE